VQLHGAVFTIDPDTKKCVKTEQVFLKI